MTTYNTGNPVPSADAKDRYDNSQTFDELVNSSSPFALNRIGAALKTWAGLTGQYNQLIDNFENQFNAFLNSQGFGYLGDYVADGPITVTALNQMFSRAGEYWVPKPSTTLPFTTTGNWASDSAFFSSRGDASVRQFLLQELADLESDADKILVDLHYGICRGTGYNGSGGQRVTTVTGAVSNGKIINVADATGFVAGQLIVYLAGDGQYYTAVTAVVAGNTIFLQTPIEVSINNGAEFGIYWRQESHPTVMGYKANADACIRRASKKMQLVRTWRPGDEHSLISGATEVVYGSASYNNPGSSAHPSTFITAPSAGAGIVAGPFKLAPGDYIARVFYTPNLNGAGAATVRVVETPVGSISMASTDQGASPTIRELNFRKSKNGEVSVTVTSQDAGQTFAVSRIEIVRLTSTVRTLDRGVHVLLGDSWFSETGFAERYAERLPNATIINKGVPGNTATGLFLRFDTDVRPYDPTFVVVNVGTNDVAGGVTPESFFVSCGIISQYIQSIGATGVFFNGSVGAPSNPDFGDLLTPSRNYAFLEDYLAATPDYQSGAETFRLPILETVGPGSTVRMVLPVFVQKSVTFKKLYVVGEAGEVTGNVILGYSTGATNLSEDLVTLPWAGTFRTNVAVPKVASGAANRFPVLALQNTGAASVTVGGYFEVEWTPIIG